MSSAFASLEALTNVASSPDFSILSKSRCFPDNSCWSISRPNCLLFSRCSVRRCARIRFFARDVVTNESQSLLGRCLLDVMISMMSPLFSSFFIGTIRPLTFAPTVDWPTAECTAKAKSRAVALAGNWITSPLGVNTNISSSKRSTLTASRNSSGSLSSFCHSTI